MTGRDVSPGKRSFPFDWIGAFTARPFSGNGCVVVHDAAGLDDTECQALVRETSLVECTFVGPSEVADFRVRYFLASREIPFAGHPTIATVASLRARGMVEDGPLTLETLAGPIPVTVKGAKVSMVQIAPTFGREVPAELVAAAVGLAPSDILGSPQLVSTGLPFCITRLASREALERACLQPAALKTYFDALGAPGQDLLEPFLFTLDGATRAGDTFARLLLAPPSPPEDPFTGSANGAMAAWLWANGLIDAPHIVAEQGHGMGRPGQADLEVLGPRGAIEGVRVTGDSYRLMSGILHL